jgi:hypothetical protein
MTLLASYVQQAILKLPASLLAACVPCLRRDSRPDDIHQFLACSKQYYDQPVPADSIQLSCNRSGRILSHMHQAEPCPDTQVLIHVRSSEIVANSQTSSGIFVNLLCEDIRHHIY